MSSRLKMVLTEDVRAEISWAVRGAGASSAAASSSAKIWVGRRVCGVRSGVDGAMKAVAVDARVARRASFIMVILGFLMLMLMIRL